jgi:starch-binding outer membrane protein, SusD/RagB family
MFGAVPFVTEANEVGSTLPKQGSRSEIFAYIESEVKAIENELTAPRQNEYGRADRGAAWALLAKLYLNAQVYVGSPKFTESITYCNKIISANAYALEGDYKNLFLADNNLSKEMIFTVQFDGVKTKTWGGMTFLVHAPVGGSMNPADFGINGGWGGLRTTKQFVGLFSDITGKTDTRAMFYTTGQNLDIAEIPTFTDGYAITKYKNITSKGVKGSDTEGNFPDNDFPVFRLADIYLTYAEAVLRGGTGGDQATALSYVNALRTRAYKGATGNVTSLNIDLMLAERGRELYWEAQRRTDLIRFGKFTDASYLWAWKGNVKDGKGVSSNLNLFPIPSSDIVANPNLKQNPGY